MHGSVTEPLIPGTSCAALILTPFVPPHVANSLQFSILALPTATYYTIVFCFMLQNSSYNKDTLRKSNSFRRAFISILSSPVTHSVQLYT